MNNDKIIFLGTAGDSFVMSKHMRSAGGLVIQTDGLQFMIDPGPGAFIKAAEYGINIRDNTALIVTNSDIRHSDGVNSVIDAMTYAGFDKKGVIIANKTVINGCEKINPVLSNKQREYVERLIVLEQDKKVGVEDLEIHALAAKSEDPNGIGLKFVTPHTTITYSSLTKFTPELAQYYKDTDILILNMQAPEKKDVDFGLSAEDAINLIRRIKPKLAITTLFGIKAIKADPLYEARRMQKETGVQTLCAKDGMMVSASSFAAKVRQKSLKSYDESEPMPEEKAEVTELEDMGVVDEGSEPLGDDATGGEHSVDDGYPKENEEGPASDESGQGSLNGFKENP